MAALELSELNHRFGIPGHLRFQKGPGGLVIAEISNHQASATLFLQGAHLARWTPRRQHSVIWLSPNAQFVAGKPIRGGVPVCWPWFADHPSETGLPFHGYARTALWEVVETAKTEDGSTRLRLHLPVDAARPRSWPDATDLSLQLTIGNVLEMELRTDNLGVEPVVLSQALHAYFHVGDVRRVEVLGLNGPYIDKLTAERQPGQAGPLTLAEAVDRIYLDATDHCLLVDPKLKRRIRIAKRGSASTVVWNPWAEKSAQMVDMGENAHLHMVCVESANVADDAVTIAPGSSHCLAVRYEVEPLAC